MSLQFSAASAVLNSKFLTGQLQDVHLNMCHMRTVSCIQSLCLKATTETAGSAMPVQFQTGCRLTDRVRTKPNCNVRIQTVQATRVNVTVQTSMDITDEHKQVAQTIH